jgi:hypothetical protein
MGSSVTADSISTTAKLTLASLSATGAGTFGALSFKNPVKAVHPTADYDVCTGAHEGALSFRDGRWWRFMNDRTLAPPLSSNFGQRAFPARSCLDVKMNSATPPGDGVYWIQSLFNASAAEGVSDFFLGCTHPRC